MRIDRVSTWTVPMALTEPYQVAYSHTGAIDAVFARVDAGAHSGFGCASPDPEVTGERPEHVRAALQAFDGALRGLDADLHGLALEVAGRVAPGVPGARAALDMALWDLRARRAGLPLWRMLGAVRGRIATFVTIGILPERETVDRARGWADRGFRALKVKGGLDAHQDGERLRAVRAAVGPDIALCLDANQGYDVAGARRAAQVAASCGAKFLEQPTGAHAVMALADVRRDSPLPVMADESVITPADALAIVRAEAADLINVKLMKLGGLDRAQAVAGIATAGGLKLMVGCMDEPERGIAAALAFALASPAVAHADLDGHFGLQGDPTAGSLALVAGELVPSEEPGLGPAPA
jgi:L-alanine-DL-glutamate epimerase-like enolase superfamily enzyme